MTAEEDKAAPVPGANGFGVAAPDSLALLQADRDRAARELEKARVAADTAAMREQAEALRRGPAQPAPDAAQGNLAQRALGMASGLVDPATLRAAAGLITDPEALRAAASLAEAAKQGGGLPGVVRSLHEQGVAAAERARAAAAAQKPPQPPTFRERVARHLDPNQPGAGVRGAIGEIVGEEAGKWLTGVVKGVFTGAPAQQPQTLRPAEAAPVQPAPRTQPDGSPAPVWPMPAGFGQPLPPTQPMPGNPAYREPGQTAQPAQPDSAANGAQPPQPTLRYIPSGPGSNNGRG